MNTKTSWGGVSKWYDKHLHGKDTYHEQVVYPNLLRLIDLQKDESLLEIGCGQGFFLDKFYRELKNQNLTGVDIGSELIKIAQKNNPKINYLVASADYPDLLSGKKFDVVLFVLSIQNMKDLNPVVANIARLVGDAGRVYLVINHPAFRIPQHSDWVFDEKTKTQCRKVDMYMSDKEIKIDMTPGSRSKKTMTRSYHRPLQVYSKAFTKNGLAITKIEEWISHKESEKGPRKNAEDSARREFPMFMCLELRKFKI